MNTPTEFGQLLRTYRKQYTARIDGLCKAIGCTKTYLMDVELRGVTPDQQWVNRWIGYILGIAHPDDSQSIVEQITDAYQKSTVKPPTEWIDIKERQPEVGQMVLFISFNFIKGKQTYFMGGSYCGFGYSDSNLGRFKNKEGLDLGSHWLPLDVLPPLPGSEGKG